MTLNTAPDRFNTFISVVGIEIETIARFNRMKQLSGDISLIVKAMKRCPSVEVSMFKVCLQATLRPWRVETNWVVQCVMGVQVISEG